MKAGKLPKARHEVFYQSVRDGGVLLDTRAEVYFGLNEVGAQIWELLPPICGSLDELCQELAKRHPGIEESTLRADVLDLLRELEESGLVQAVPDAVMA